MDSPGLTALAESMAKTQSVLMDSPGLTAFAQDLDTAGYLWESDLAGAPDVDKEASAARLLAWMILAAALAVCLQDPAQSVPSACRTAFLILQLVGAVSKSNAGAGVMVIIAVAPAVAAVWPRPPR
jgi:hypothetical protein